MARNQLFCLTLVLSSLAQANESPDLARESEDPTAPLPTVTLKDDYTPEFWHRGGRRHTYALTVVNPFRAWNRPNLLGVNLPYDSGDGMASGAGSPQILDLVVFNHAKGRWAVGLAVILGPAGRKVLKYGPAMGFVSVIDQCNYGLLNLNFFNDDVSLSAIQLIAGCAMGNSWTVSTGNFVVTYDWRTGRLIEVPLSLQIGKIVSLFGQPVKTFINPRFNFQDTTGTGQWTFTVGFTLIADPSKVDL